ncbi:hypothetical protein LTAR_00090 [Leptolinea tardivitalis]|nr:hypothetical protein LTAR_00090 [Leptolinea tardivitalis]
MEKRSNVQPLRKNKKAFLSKGFFVSGWPVSRVLSGGEVSSQTVSSWMIISLDGMLPYRSSSLPGIIAETGERAAPRTPKSASSLLDLAAGGGCLAGASRRRRWSFTPPFHPYSLTEAVCFCGPVPRLPAAGVTRHPALCSADFPRHHSR